MPRFKDSTLQMSRNLPGSAACSSVPNAMWAGSSSIYLDGTAPANGVNQNYPLHNFVGELFGAVPLLTYSADFTWEGYVRFDAGTLTADRYIYLNGNGSGWWVYFKSSSGRLVLGCSGSDRVSGSAAISAGTVYKWSVTRSSGVATLRVNGVSQGTYSNAESIGFGSSMYWGSDGGVGRLLIGHLDELAAYRSAKYTGDYTPLFAETPDTLAGDPARESISYLYHGDEAIAQSSASLAALDSLSLYAPSWPVTLRVTPDAQRLDPLRSFGARGLSGVVDYITAPAAGRIVRAYDKASGILLRETTTAGDGSYSFPDLLGGRDYYVVALDSPPNPASAFDTDISPIVQAT